MAQREPVLAQLLLEPRPGRPGLDPRRQRDRVDLEHPVEPPQVDASPRGRSPSRGSTPPTTLVPPPNGITAAPSASAQVEHRLDLRLVAREGDQVRRVLELAPEAAHDVPVGLAERVGRPARSDRREKRSPKRSGGFSRGSRSSTCLERHRLLDLARPEPEAASRNRRSADLALELRRRGGLPGPRTPSPSASASAAVAECAAAGYQWTPLIRCAKATASVEGALVAAPPPPLPFAACESGKSL